MRDMKDSGIEWVGKIPDEWSVAHLKYACSFKTGGTPNNKKGIENEGDYMWVTPPDITDSYTILQTKQWISNEAIKNSGYTLFPKQSVLLVCIASVGKVGIINKKAYSNQQITALKPKCEIMFPKYLLYSIAAGSKQISFDASSNVIPIVNTKYLEGFSITFPQIEEQVQIADFLDTKCADIDALSTDIQSEIDTLEAYKRAVITEAVTKGLDRNVPMKDSGIPWIGIVPAHWSIYRIADLYEDRNERGNESLPLLSVSINSGVSDKELSDDEQERVFIRSEDKSKYKRVYPGDITYNMMRAWQGAFGAVRVDGMVSPAYVVAKQKRITDIDSRFIEALIRSPMGIEEMNRFSYGIMDFRKRLYWPQFRIMKVCLPDINEQRMIADYIDLRSVEIDSVITKKQEQLALLAEYKKSLIYEYVTGKKEVPAS